VITNAGDGRVVDVREVDGPSAASRPMPVLLHEQPDQHDDVDEQCGDSGDDPRLERPAWAVSMLTDAAWVTIWTSAGGRCRCA
jgi:hypothetical protein